MFQPALIRVEDVEPLAVGVEHTLEAVGVWCQNREMLSALGDFGARPDYDAERVTFPVRLAEKDAIQAAFTSPNQVDPFTVPLADKVAFLQAMDEKLNQPGVLQRISQVMFMRKQIIFLDSEGSEIEKNIIEAFPSIRVMGMDANGEAHVRKFSPFRRGETRGWETLDME